MLRSTKVLSLSMCAVLEEVTLMAGPLLFPWSGLGVLHGDGFVTVFFALLSTMYCVVENPPQVEGKAFLFSLLPIPGERQGRKTECWYCG